MSALRTTALLRTSTRSLSTFQTPAKTARRSFQSFRPLAVGKESAVHEEGRAEKVEAIKQDQLQKQKEGKNEHKEELMSDSESIVKADRGEMNGKGTIEQLQKESAQAAQNEKDRK